MFVRWTVTAVADAASRFRRIMRAREGIQARARSNATTTQTLLRRARRPRTDRRRGGAPRKRDADRCSAGLAEPEG